MEIKLFNKQSLQQFINSTSFLELKNIPISSQRALSHLQNPRADTNDILLLVAYQNTEIIGYLGVLPDFLYYNKQVEKIGWFSCLWVDEQQRGKKIAQQLVQKCIAAWEQRILVTEFTDPAEKLYAKTGVFDALQQKLGIRLYIRSDLQTLLPPKKEIFRKFKEEIKLFDSIFNLIFDNRFYFFKPKQNNFTIENISEITSKTENFIHSQQQNQLFKRRATELNWILNNPWLSSSQKAKTESEKYNFSVWESSFSFTAIQLLDSNKNIVAFLLFAKRNKLLKLPYCYFSCEVSEIVKTINLYLIKWQIKTFTTFHNQLVTALWEAKTPALYKKTVHRKYIISKRFDGQLFNKNGEIQDGDADCSFT